jgi:hypothetical protein
MLTRCSWFLLCAAIASAVWLISMTISHPIKAEMWLAVAVVLLIQAVAERLKT